MAFSHRLDLHHLVGLYPHLFTFPELNQIPERYSPPR